MSAPVDRPARPREADLLQLHEAGYELDDYDYRALVGFLRAELLASRQDADRLAERLAGSIGDLMHGMSRMSGHLPDCGCGAHLALAAHAALVAGPKPVRSACPDLAVEE